MTVQHGPPTSDLTYPEAIKAAQVDFARLMHLHDVSWRVDLACSRLILYCSCDNAERTPKALEAHIIKAVHDARGPVKR